MPIARCAAAALLFALAAIPSSADARSRHHIRHHRLFAEVPRPPTDAETAAYRIGALSGWFVQGIGAATDALPAPSYPQRYVLPGARLPGDN